MIEKQIIENYIDYIIPTLERRVIGDEIIYGCVNDPIFYYFITIINVKNGRTINRVRTCFVLHLQMFFPDYDRFYLNTLIENRLKIFKLS